MATRTRRDVYKLADWDPILEWYGKAVREMRRRESDPDDPRSFRYQAAIHEFNGDGTPAADADTYWNQCQHNSWFFLSWHRWYLLYFEEIVANTVVELGGPAGWSLPYWNYSEDTAVNPSARILPKAFRDLKMPDGSDNPLRIEERSARANGGRDVTSGAGVSLDCLKERRFVAPAVGGIAGFGGPRTRFNHGGGNVGALERTPHGDIHVGVGGPGGFMSAFDTAGLDPIFWLHHCNIDRLWDVWIKRDPHHKNPTEALWLDDIEFPFHDGSGGTVKKTSRGAIDTVALGYKYEDTSDPLAAPGAPVLASAEAEAPTMAEEEEPVAEMVGASEEPVRLATRPATTEVAVSPPAGPVLAGAAAKERRIYVTLENVTGEGVAMNYHVYVNDKLAGTLPMFGVREASRASDRHAGSGLEFRYDVTDIVRETGADPRSLKVTFMPDIDEEDMLQVASLAGAAEEPAFNVGRVSVYVA